MESAAASSSKPPQRQSCRVCSDEKDLFSQMRRTMYADARKKDKKPKQQQSISPTTQQHKEAPQQQQPKYTATTTAAAAATAATGVASSCNTTTQQPPTPTSAPTTASPSFLAASHPLPCPPDATRLGRSTWTFLHTMAAYYPTHPTHTQQQHATQLLHSLTTLYPCQHCATHLTSYYTAHPPQQYVGGRSELSGFLCRVHNDVRARQRKRLFDCGRVLERWGGHDWEETHDDSKCDEREYGDVEDEERQGG